MPVDYSVFLTIAVGLPLALLAGAWGRHLLSQSAHGWSLSDDHLVRCRRCGCTYLVRRAGTMTQCPTCATVNRVRPRKHRLTIL